MASGSKDTEVKAPEKAVSASDSAPKDAEVKAPEKAVACASLAGEYRVSIKKMEEKKEDAAEKKKAVVVGVNVVTLKSPRNAPIREEHGLVLVLANKIK